MRQAHTDPVSSPTVDVLRRALHIKGSSLVMTLFGDAIAMRAQPIWLSSLIRLASPFGLMIGCSQPARVAAATTA